MSINPLKEFFKRRKAEAKFSKAGPGQKLSSDSQQGQSSSSTEARQAAAEAAMKRFNKDNTKQVARPRVVPADLPQAKPSADQDSKATTACKYSTPQAQKELPIVDGIPQRNVHLFTTEELASRIKQPEIDDDFFRLTVEDAKLFQQRFTEERARNEILKTSEMRKREAESKKLTMNVARLRFKLPNNMVLEASFSGSELLGAVRDWLVAICLDKISLDLKEFDMLMGVRPFKGDDFDKSIRQLSLIPATTLTIVQKN